MRAVSDNSNGWVCGRSSAVNLGVVQWVDVDPYCITVHYGEDDFDQLSHGDHFDLNRRIAKHVGWRGCLECFHVGGNGEVLWELSGGPSRACPECNPASPDYQSRRLRKSEVMCIAMGMDPSKAEYLLSSADKLRPSASVDPRWPGRTCVECGKGDVSIEVRGKTYHDLCLIRADERSGRCVCPAPADQPPCPGEPCPTEGCRGRRHKGEGCVTCASR